MTVLSQLADVLRGVSNLNDAISRLNHASLKTADMDASMVRVRSSDSQTFYVELRPLRSFPVAEITFEGVFVQPAVVFWPRWVIYDNDAELIMVVKVEEHALVADR